MSLEVPITLAPRYSVRVSLGSPTGGGLELLPPQTAIVAQLQSILRGERGLDGAAGQDGQDGRDGADANLSADIHAAPAKASPDDADELGYLDSAGSWALVKASWAQLKASLKTSFDTTYLAKTGGTLSGALVGTQIGVVAGHYFYGSGGAANYFVGRDVLRISYGSVEIQNAALSLFDGTYRSYLQADGAANTLAQRNGTNAQTFRLYNTYTDASNYERGFVRWNANVLEIGTEAGGTGTARNLRLTSKTQVGSATSYLEFDQATRSITGFLQGSYGTTFTLGLQSFSVVDTGNTGQTIFSASIYGFRANKITSGTIAGIVYSPLNLYANYFPSSSSTPAFTIGVYDTGGNGITDRLQIFNGDAGRMVLQCNSTGNISLWGATSSFPALKRNAAGLEFRLADDSGFAAISAATVKTQAFTVATLPSAASAGTGACAYVTDATASTFMSVVAGGGSNKVPVVSDGVNWLIG